MTLARSGTTSAPAPERRRVSRALLVGFYGRQNCGDDALFIVSAWACRKFFMARRLYATSGRDLTHLDAGTRPVYLDDTRRGTYHLNLLRERWFVSRSNMVAFGGGSLFHSRHDLDRWSGWLSRAKRGSRFAAGVSIGPFSSAADEAACAQLLRQFDFVGVRDQASLDRARDLSPSTKTELTFDIAPLLYTDVAPLDSTPSTEHHARSIVVSLCEPRAAGAVRPGWIRELTAALKQVLAEGLADRVVLTDFNSEVRGRGRADGQVHKELMSELGSTQVEHVPYSGNPHATIGLVRQASVVLAMRLHAAVFGYVHDRPTVILPYHEKCVEWAAMIRQPEALTLRMAEWGTADVVRSLSTALSSSPPRPGLPLLDARARALQNWTWRDA